MKLHIGSAKKRLPGWTSVDIRSGVGADIVADARDIKLPANSVEAIYACHILEHFPREEVVSVLKHWVRLLSSDGVLYLAVPHFLGLMYAYEASGLLGDILPALFGGQNYKENFHYTAFDYMLLTQYMSEAGIKEGGFWHHQPMPRRMGTPIMETAPFNGRTLVIPDNYYDYSMLTINGILCSLNVWGKK